MIPKGPSARRNVRQEGLTTDAIRTLKTLGDTADGLYVVDHQQRIVRWNRAAQRLLGYTADDALHRLCYEVIAGCGRNGQSVCGPDCPVHRCVERGELPHSMEVHARTKDGRRLWLHLSVIVIPHEPGPLSVHVLHDVSERRHATEVMTQIATMLHVEGAAPQGDRAHALPERSQHSPEPGQGVHTLTMRERHVLRLVADGLSNRAIAIQLQVSVFTIRNHVQHILTKLGAHNRAEAVSLALRTPLP